MPAREDAGRELDETVLPHRGNPALELRPLVVDTRGVARLLGLCERTVRALNASGRLPRALALGRRRVWPVREIEAWLEAGAPERSRWEELRGRRA
jgi:predicted DNA-binding transcriptional regulator AlpA